jgi:hypothetical protein
MPTVSIHARYKIEAEDKLAKLARRAARYGQEIKWSAEPFVVIEKRRPVAGKNEVYYEVKVPMIKYTVEGEAPSAGPYEFVAELERVDGGVIVTGRAIELDGFGRDWDGECQHCRQNRARKIAYVVRHKEDGGFMIVGKSCLRDYTGHDTPDGLLFAFQWLRDLEAMGGDDEGGFGGRGRWTRDTLGTIAAARAAIRLYGWVPSSRREDGMRTTASVVGLLDYCSGRDKEGQKMRNALQAELERAANGDECYFDDAAKIIDWAGEMVTRTDYERNLKVALRSSYVIEKTYGLVISASAAYDRQKARRDEVAERIKAEKAAQALAANEWFGETGKRVEADLVLVSRIVMPDRGFGESILHTFRLGNAAGPLIKWFASNGIGIRADAGKTIKAKFTIKKHDEFRDQKQTVVSRLAVLA